MNDAVDPEGGGARASALERRLARGLQFADMLGFTNQRKLNGRFLRIQARKVVVPAAGCFEHNQ